mgnify:FL=1|tara:strand:- start:80 stop:700 length:621 start_codon:yes stop_codon:yes gene_type:complete
MGFNPSQQTRDNADLAVRYGLGGVVPASGGARRVFYENARKGGNLRVRIEAAQAQGYSANTIAEIEYFEKVTSPEYIAEQQRIADEKEAARLAEIARLELIAKNDNIALNLWTRLDNQRIAKEKAEAKRLADVAEAQRLAAIEKERLRIQLLDEQEKERIRKEQEIKDIAEAKEFQRVDKSIPLIASVLPITALGILLLYTRGGKK